VGYKELKKTGAFFVPGFAKFIVIKKPATKARKGINPVHKGANNIQGEAGSEDHKGSAGKGCQRCGVVASKISMEHDGGRGAMEHAPTPECFASPLMKRVEGVVVDECVGQESPLVGQLRQRLGERQVKFVFLATVPTPS
jgi:hypothetical protein